MRVCACCYLEPLEAGTDGREMATRHYHHWMASSGRHAPSHPAPPGSGCPPEARPAKGSASAEENKHHKPLWSVHMGVESGRYGDASPTAKKLGWMSPQIRVAFYLFSVDHSMYV